MRTGTLGTTQEANALISDEIREVVEMIVVVVLDAVAVMINTVVVEPTVTYQALPFRPARRYVCSRILVEIFPEVACNEDRHADVLTLCGLVLRSTHMTRPRV